MPPVECPLVRGTRTLHTHGGQRHTRTAVTILLLHGAADISKAGFASGDRGLIERLPHWVTYTDDVARVKWLKQMSALTALRTWEGPRFGIRTPDPKTLPPAQPCV